MTDIAALKTVTVLRDLIDALEHPGAIHAGFAEHLRGQLQASLADSDGPALIVTAAA